MVVSIGNSKMKEVRDRRHQCREYRRLRLLRLQRRQQPSDFRLLAWVECWPPFSTHLGHRKSLVHYTNGACDPGITIKYGPKKVDW